MAQPQQSMGELRWKCRRGMLELDILMTRYLERAYANSDSDIQYAFIEMLDLEDPLLASWLLKGKPADNTRYQQVVDTALRLHVE